MIVTESGALKGQRRVPYCKLILKGRRDFLKEMKSSFVSE